MALYCSFPLTLALSPKNGGEGVGEGVDSFLIFI